MCLHKQTHTIAKEGVALSLFAAAVAATMTLTPSCASCAAPLEQHRAPMLGPQWQQGWGWLPQRQGRRPAGCRVLAWQAWPQLLLLLLPQQQ